MSNIVYAQNKALTETFGTECFITEFTNIISFDIGRMVQGRISSNIAFYTEEELPSLYIENTIEGCSLAEGITIRTPYGLRYKYSGILLFGSKLREKLLNVMLEYNGDRSEVL